MKQGETSSIRFIKYILEYTSDKMPKQNKKLEEKLRKYRVIIHNANPNSEIIKRLVADELGDNVEVVFWKIEKATHYKASVAGRMLPQCDMYVRVEYRDKITEKQSTLKELKDLVIEDFTGDANDIAIRIAMVLKENILFSASHCSRHFPLMERMKLIEIQGSQPVQSCTVTDRGRELYKRLKAEGFYNTKRE